MSYNHTQKGWAIIVSLAILIGIEAPLLFLLPQDAHTTILATTLAVSLVLLLFATLTVSVDSQKILIYFGPGIIRRTIQISHVTAVEAIATKWWYGFGIRLTPIGWMWNVSGLRGVKLTYTNGKSFVIGTDDPEGLVQAVKSLMG